MQPFFSASLEDRLKRAVEDAKVEAGQREAASEWMKAALAVDDAAERGKAVRFIAKAGLLPGVDPSIKEIKDEDVPKIPRADTTKPSAPAAQAAAETGKPPRMSGR